ncbi:peptidylprolyl isomerase [Aquabacterium sp. J223]|uniref:peptidylprolyl isomerase n=1 Tax=Aquabacterium sp. J223 TaxID=2898431 RepID=UPI0021ADD9BD|nr:peptidylprolyl isomerase [Aquabacterium sp. J223]UUX96021.1 peptidylprolyl isomerase [Aquabacterium sp. J223]
MTDPSLWRRLSAFLLGALLAAGAAAQSAPRDRPRSADYIVAVVNQELVTQGELAQRVARLRQEAARANQPVPPEGQLAREALDDLIDERVLLTFARETGPKVDEAELDRAVGIVAQQNQLTVPQLRERLQRDGVDYARFRANVRDQLLVERVREREVQSRLRVSDSEVTEFLDQMRRTREAELNIAQLLVAVPEGASEAVLAERRQRAEQALARARAGEPFEALVRELSDGGNKEAGGALGLRPSSRLPDAFLDATRGLEPGQVAPQLLRTGAGFHVLKLVERRQDAMDRVTQTRARHILLRPTPQQPAPQVARRLAEYKQQIERGAASFEALARQHSDDGSAAQGGDLGWVSPGVFVPEFQQAMDRLPVGGLSDPVPSRFGIHLIQVLDRRAATLEPAQVREMARAQLREQRYEQTLNDWVRELRGRAYIELREPPSP